MIGCGALLALSVVVILVALVGSVVGGGGSNEQPTDEPGSRSADSEKKSKPNKTGADNVQANVGQTAELSDRILIVNEIERNYAPPTRVPNPERGNEFVRVSITLTNTGKETFDYNPNNFKVQDSNGVQQTPRNPSRLPYAFNHGSLAPDGTLRGNMVFQVPQGDEGLGLVYEPFERRSLGTITVTL
jgi:Domain of unknown function (DUF4352)